MKLHILQSRMEEYAAYLYSEERSQNTIKKYIHDLQCFFNYADETVSKETVLGWKEELVKRYASASVNSMLAAVNGYFEWMQIPQLKVKPVKIQRTIFAKPERELTQVEYKRLVRTAQKNGDERLSLVLQTICATGIRVSELRYITVETVRTGRSCVECKGKTRTIFLPKALCQSITRYCKKRRINKGIVFCTINGAPLNRSNIWRDMKNLCEEAGVAQSKVFPHNLRHLFARTYYTLEKDLSRLADLLGHSNISTTRVYTMETGAQHIRQLERMGLVL